MIDIQQIRKNPQAVEKKLRTRHPGIELADTVFFDAEMRRYATQIEALKAEKNKLSRIFAAARQRGEKCHELQQEGKRITDKVSRLEQRYQQAQRSLQAQMMAFPNLPLDEVVVSSDSRDQRILRSWGEKPRFSFTVKNHLQLNQELRLFDFERGAKIAGRGWPVYRHDAARLEWALLDYMTRKHLASGYRMWMLPAVVRKEVLLGAGQLPKFGHQLFTIPEDGQWFYLIPTAEVPLSGLHGGEILPKHMLPLRYFSYTPCFRREAGAAGVEERGLIRSHQFNKVELFAITTPAASMELFDEMVALGESLLQDLRLHYRVVSLVTGDLPFSSCRTVDLEVWLAGQNRYYEVSSISHCSDFQARRAQIRFRSPHQKSQLVHTLNGSALATSRLLVAILESNQRADGSIELPEPLRPYMGGLSELSTDFAHP